MGSIITAPASPAVLRRLLPRLQIVATRGCLGTNLGGSGGYTRMESEIRARTGREAVADLQLLYGNWYLNASAGEAAGPQAQVLEAAIRLGAASCHRAGFNGADTAALSAGAQRALSSPVPVDLAPGSDIHLRTSLTKAAPGTDWCAGHENHTADDVWFQSTAATAQVVGTAPLAQPAGGSSSQSRTIGPLAVLGVPERPMPAVVIVGDSIDRGTTDNPQGRPAVGGDGQGNAGPVERGLFNVGGYPVPWVSMTRGSDRAVSNSLALGPRKRDVLQYATDAYVKLGTNDILGGLALDDVKAALSALWTAIRRRGLRVTAATLPPNTNAANTSLTAGFEVGGRRDQLNAWIAAARGSLLHDVIDLNAAWEDPARPGFWVPGYDGDGTHPTTALHAAGATLVAAWARRLG